MKLPSLLFVLLAASGVASVAADSVTAKKETIVLPTYLPAPPDLNPRFYTGRTYQGARATFYPYPVSDQMTEAKEPRPYTSLTLENKYISFSVLPELGGRIFTAQDKGNGYDFFYRQHVIKPALIGMLGAWISGGVEWNVPHHHRASSFMPVDHTLEENRDGSKTVWVGETELRHRLRWLVGMTLRPDRSYIEMTVKLFNRTPEAQAFLFWINPAVHANQDYQVIFPPSTEWAVQHSKPEFAAWPIARQRYGGTDYTRGVDISWWKNHPSPVSFFAWDCREDFFGGYDHGKKAGVIQISNHHVSPGKKFFEWGNGPEGEMWSKILSDEDGPYLELMAGSYSDNQPDYSWCQPGETKIFKHYWYPVREIGGFKNANTEAAVNLDVTNSTVHVAFNTTTAHPKAVVSVETGDRMLLKETIRISPTEPFQKTLAIPAGISTDSLKASLSAGSQELVSYTSQPQAGTPMPKPARKPRPPKEAGSTEELYLTGLRLEQLFSPSFDPVPYYREALGRDPGDYRANTALGALFCRQGRFEEAEPLLRKALERATENYIRPKDNEADYYLGVSLRAQGKTSAARESFYRAIWGHAWQSAGYLALAELACEAGNLTEAVELAQNSITAGALNTKALELMACLLRRTGDMQRASDLNSRILQLDPLNPRAAYELTLLDAKKKARLNQFLKNMRGEVTSYLELATDYGNAGFYKEAVAVLDTYLEHRKDKTQPNPLTHYYLGYYHEKLGRSEEALKHVRQASTMPLDYCFPFQWEAAVILRKAMELNPTDGRVAYYLGNLLFDNQPEKAMAAWERALQQEPGLAPAHRNLGLARAQASKDVNGAVASLEKAIALDPGNSRIYYELDVLYEAAGTALDKRLALLTQNPGPVERRDDAVTRRVIVQTASGQLAPALLTLKERRFHNWEGSSSLHDTYVDACLTSGLKHLSANRAQEALTAFRAALEYPSNQEVGKSRHERRVAQIHFLAGAALDRQGKTAEAKAEFERAASSDEGGPSEGLYYKALALKKNGKAQEADTIFQSLLRFGEEELARESEEADYFAKFGERRVERLRHAHAHFIAGLGSLGLGKPEQAGERFTKALELHPGHLGALNRKAGVEF